MATLINLSKSLLIACVLMHTVIAYSPKNVVYWGQESDGSEQALRNYCTGTFDVIVMAFVYNFPTDADTPGSAYPALNFAGHCSTSYNSANPNLLICPEIAADITYCQSQGVQILLSFGGAEGTYGFSSDTSATTFATTVWNMFLGGSSTIRPFGSAVLDGIDLDIESGSTNGYAAFITQLRSYFAGASKTYYISSAPQCPFPDALIGPGAGTAMQTAWFDYIWVQFYNNYCGLNAPSQYNFESWANWATETSVNPNVKIFIGAPAGPRAAGSGFVSSVVLQGYAVDAMAQYPTVYGGVMLWDTSNSDNNNNFGAAVAEFVHVIESAIPSTPSVSTPSTPVGSSTSTTGKKTSTSTSTTGKPSTSTSTTGKPSTSTSTTGKKTSTSTTGSSKTITTTGSSPATPVVISTPASPASAASPSSPASAASPSSPASSASATCVPGYMKCLTSETYSTCNRGAWGASQSCQVGLTCSASGDYIYCV